MSYAVTFRSNPYPEEPTSCLEWAFEGVCELYERVTNLINLMRKKELLGPISKCHDPAKPLTRFRMGFGEKGFDWHIFSEPAVMKAILDQQFRNGDLFELPAEGNGLFLFFEKCFNEKIKPNDSIIFCDSEHSALYHGIFRSFLGAKEVSTYFPMMEKMTDAFLDSLPDEGEVNISALLKKHIVSVTATAILDYSPSKTEKEDPGSWERLVQALDFANAYGVQRETKAGDEKKLEAATLTLQHVIDTIVEREHNPDSFVSHMKQLVEEEKMTLLQMKIMIFMILFGGYQSTTNLSIYATFQLAKAPEEQTKLLKSIEQSSKKELTSLLKLKTIRNIVAESLRLFPAGYFGFRQPKDVVGVEITYSEYGTVVREEHFNLKKKDHQALIAGHYFAARNPKIYPKPDHFNPDRFDESGQLPWLPFGSGPNKCPGEWFARPEFKLLLLKFTQAFEYSTDLESITVLGLSSLVVKEDVMLYIKRREESSCINSELLPTEDQVGLHNRKH